MSNDVPEMPTMKWTKDFKPDFTELEEEHQEVLDRKQRRFAASSRERREQELLHGVPEMPSTLEDCEED